jgi:SAM-dependent methyltransferase
VFGRARRPDGRSSYAWLADQAPSGAVLDLACGDGPLLALLIERGAHPEGLDRSAAELSHAARRVPGARLHEADAHSLPFPDGSFDAVLSHMALMLIPDGDQVAREIVRVSKRGAVFAGVVGAGVDRDSALVGELMPAIHTVLEEAGLAIDYPSERWSDADLARRLPGATVQSETFVVSQRVELHDFPRFIGLHYYGVGLLEEPFRAQADAISHTIGMRHAVDGAVRWTTAMRGFRAELPGRRMVHPGGSASVQ